MRTLFLLVSVPLTLVFFSSAQQANRPGKRHRQHLVHDRRDAASLRHGVWEPCPHQSRTASDHASVCQREQVLANTATTLSDRVLRLLCTSTGAEIVLGLIVICVVAVLGQLEPAGDMHSGAMSAMGH